MDDVTRDYLILKVKLLYNSGCGGTRPFETELRRIIRDCDGVCTLDPAEIVGLWINYALDAAEQGIFNKEDMRELIGLYAYVCHD